jgi:hypothetical protein
MAKSEYVSGEKYREMAPAGNTKNGLPKPVLAIIAVVVLMGLSFYGGTAYQKSKQPKAASAAAAGTKGGFSGRGGGRFGGQRPTIGQVTAISSTSITVQDSSTNASTTLAITSNTQITDNGQTVTVSDIQTGSSVLVVASTTDKTQAARILVNPSFGGGTSQSGSSGTSPDDSGSAVTN